MSDRGITRKCMYFNIVNIVLLRWSVVSFKRNEDIFINDSSTTKMMMPRRGKMTIYMYLLIYDD